MINRASQVTADTIFEENISDFNNSIKFFKGASFQQLLYYSLDTYNMTFKGYSDASFAFNDDLSSQIG